MKLIASNQLTLTNVIDGKDGNKVYTSKYELSANQTGVYLSDLTPTADATNLPPIGSIVVAPSGKMYPIVALNLTSNPPSYTSGALVGNIKGPQGAPGAEGKTTYIHFAYADDSKGTNFSLTDNNQRYQGYYSDYTQADSTDYTKYKWVDRLANVQIGTNNLIKGTGSAFVMGYGITNTTWDDDKKWAYLDLTDPNNNPAKRSEILPQGQFWNFKPIKGTTYTQSIMIDTDATFNPDGQAQCKWYAWIGSDVQNQQKAYINKVGEHTYRVWSTFTWNLEDTALRAFDWVDLHNLLLFRNSGTYLAFYKPKLTTGNLPSDWSAAPEDTQEQINNKADETITQDQLNALKEQSELHQKELDSKADLDTIEKWYQEYLDYVNIDNDNREKSEAALIAISERVAAITNDLGQTKERWNFIDTYMDAAEEGLVIGKQDGSANIKISNDRISMFSNGDEVMWISQNMLHIANGVFVQTLQIGNFRFESLDVNGEILGLRYLGG